MYIQNVENHKVILEDRKKWRENGLFNFNNSWVSFKTFWKRIYKETKRKRKISEKRQFFQERFFQRKFSFPWENSLFPYFSLIIHWKHLEREFTKRQREREKSQKRREVFEERFFPEKILFSKRKVSFHIFFSKHFGEELSNMKIEALDV